MFKSLKLMGMCLLMFLLLISACGSQSNYSDLADEKKAEDSTITSSDNDSSGSDSSDYDSSGSNSSSNSSPSNDLPSSDSSSNNSSGDNYSTDESKSNAAASISYPEFTNIKNEERVNQLIFDYINELDSLYNDDNPAALSINYQIMFQNEQYLSIYFSGDLKGRAYPSIFKSTLNIDLTQVSRMTLSQIVNLNDDFTNKATNAIQEKFNSIGADMDALMPGGIKGKLEHADSTTSDAQSYFTSNEVVIILAVQHAIGDYIEVSIPFTSVENYIM